MPLSAILRKRKNCCFETVHVQTTKCAFRAQSSSVVSHPSLRGIHIASGTRREPTDCRSKKDEGEEEGQKMEKEEDRRARKRETLEETDAGSNRARFG